MKLDKDELMKLFDFILENKDITISDDGQFSRDTLITIRKIVKGEIPNDFMLTKEQEKIIIDTFINSDNVFNEDTPYFILENPTCIDCSIKRNINSVNFLREVDSNIQSTVIDEVQKSKYVLSVRTPLFLRKNISVILNSIMYDVNSADYIEWDYIVESDRDKLINEIIKSGYKLSYTSSSYLSNNLKLVMNSLKDNMDNIRFVGASIENHPSVIEFMLLNDYPYNQDTLGNLKLKDVTDIRVFSKCLKRIFNEESNFIDICSKVYCASLNNLPTIKTFDYVFQYVIDESWKNYRNDNLDKFGNVFGKIVAELKNNNDFDVVIRDSVIIYNLKRTLGEKYDILYIAMKEYFNIYHSDVPNKLEKIQESKDTISKLSALYNAKSKENHKNSKLKELHNYIYNYFTLNLENPYINKKIVDDRKKVIFKETYIIGDKYLLDFLNKLTKKYSSDIGIENTEKIIKSFILHDLSKIEKIIPAPNKYDVYKKYKKCSKLINRLNSGYIKYDGVEVANYKDLISFDNEKDRYVYSGISFSDSELDKIYKYQKYESVFNKIKKDITLKRQTIEYDGKVDGWYLHILADDLPFNDEYFKFDIEILNNIKLIKFLNIMPNFTGYDIKEDKYNFVYDLLVNKGLIWLLVFMFEDYRYELDDLGINEKTIRSLINNMKKIIMFANEFNFNLTNFGELIYVYNIKDKVDKESLAILGKNVVEKLYKNYDYDYDDILNKAKRMVCQMVKRSKSTVPYISSKTMNYNYSLYDSQDETILLSGIYTDSCFKIDGDDNDFLHYCALDKNGFVIKITNYCGAFVARASGFRNGNCVFINQLRTIYDTGGIDKEQYDVNNEIKEIIKTFKQACEDIVKISKNNPNEINKIDYVFVTKSYCLCDFESNVSDEIENIIGGAPLDMESDDWDEFCNNTFDLYESECGGSFTTDFGSYPLICVASSKKGGTIEIGDIKTKDIKLKDVPAVYERKRNKITVTSIYDEVIQEKVNRIKAINSYLTKTDFIPVKIGNNSNVFVGDNWYIIYNDGNITDCCLLDFDNKAKIEFFATKAVILKYGLEYNNEFHNDEISEILYSDDFKNNVKVLEQK